MTEHLNKIPIAMIDGIDTPLDDIANVKLNRNVLTWSNPTSPTFDHLVVYESAEDMSSWTREYCNENLMPIYSGTIEQTTLRLEPNIDTNVKIFCIHNVSGVIKYSDGIAMHIVGESTFYYQEGKVHSYTSGGWSRGQTQGEVNIQMMSNKIHIEALGSSSIATVTNGKGIDLSPVRTIVIDCMMSGDIQGDSAIQLSIMKNGEAVKSATVPTARGLVKINVSDLEDWHFINLISTDGAILEVYNVWGEWMSSSDLAYNKANEAFQAGNNVKNDTVSALLSIQDDLPITPQSAWADIINGILLIDTGGGDSGVKIAMGRENSSTVASDYSFTLANGTTQTAFALDITLDFNPDLVYVYDSLKNGFSLLSPTAFKTTANNTASKIWYGAHTEAGVTTSQNAIFRVNVSDASNRNGFVLPVRSSGLWNYIAIKLPS